MTRFLTSCYSSIRNSAFDDSESAWQRSMPLLNYTDTPIKAAPQPLGMLSV